MGQKKNRPEAATSGRNPTGQTHEAELLTQYYVKRKGEGAQLPGKIRDRVAEQLEMSRTHLARLAAIKNNLKVPGFERDFKADRLSESVAYEISKLSLDAQYRLLDYSIERGQPVTTPLIKRFSTIYSMGLSITSRCRLVLPKALTTAAVPAPEGEDEFTARLRRRQAAALGGE